MTLTTRQRYFLASSVFFNMRNMLHHNYIMSKVFKSLNTEIPNIIQNQTYNKVQLRYPGVSIALVLKWPGTLWKKLYINLYVWKMCYENHQGNQKQPVPIGIISIWHHVSSQDINLYPSFDLHTRVNNLFPAVHSCVRPSFWDNGQLYNLHNCTDRTTNTKYFVSLQ